MVGLGAGVDGGDFGAADDFLIADGQGADEHRGDFVDAAVVDTGRRDAAPAVGVALLQQAAETALAACDGGLEVIV